MEIKIFLSPGLLEWGTILYNLRLRPVRTMCILDVFWTVFVFSGHK